MSSTFHHFSHEKIADFGEICCFDQKFEDILHKSLKSRSFLTIFKKVDFFSYQIRSELGECLRFLTKIGVPNPKSQKMKPGYALEPV